MTRAGRARPFAAIAILATVVGLAVPALGHETPYSWIDVDLDASGANLRVTLHPDDAAALIGVERGVPSSSPDLLIAHRVVLARALAARVRVAGGGSGAPRWTGIESVPERRSVALQARLDWERTPARIQVSARLSDDPAHETYLAVRDRGRLVRQAVLTVEHPEASIFMGGARGALAALFVFVPAGIHHIAIGPDHILFVIGLLLAGGGVARVVRIVTAFTLAHSITLALAALNVVQVPAHIVEPAIALSIIVVGLDALRARADRRDLRARFAFAFGLVHGFGFASVLREIGLPREALAASLVGFNLGVEVGQACIVLAVAPLLGLLRVRAPRLERATVAAAACGVAVAGAWWLVQRTLGTG